MNHILACLLALLFSLSGPAMKGNAVIWHSPLAAKTAVHGHHPLPKFLGGDASQLLSKLDPKIHTEFHQILRQNLKDAGIPLNVGRKGGSAADWAQYMQFNPGGQRTAFDSVLNASRAIDTKYSTQITQDMWKNIMSGSFTPYP